MERQVRVEEHSLACMNVKVVRLLLLEYPSILCCLRYLYPFLLSEARQADMS